MKKFLLLCVAATLICSMSFAKVLRVGFLGTPVVGVDFTTGQAAHDAAAIGDTIQFYPKASGYTIGLNKRLVLLGSGYLLSGTGSNANLNSIGNANAIDIYPVASSTGSDGTIISGFYSGYVYLTNNVTLSNITITRCYTAYFDLGSVSQFCSVTDSKITQCFNPSISRFSNGILGIVQRPYFLLTNFRVENCIISNISLGVFDPNSTMLFNNCIFQGGINVAGQNMVIQNSILYNNTALAGTNNTIFNNNLFSNSPTVTGANNQFNVNVGGAGANVFVGYPTQGSYSNDARYQLTAISPAKGAGIGGEDLGIFGGLNPYRLSGIPATPAIYKLQAASTNATTNPYQITLSVRSNN